MQVTSLTTVPASSPRVVGSDGRAPRHEPLDRESAKPHSRPSYRHYSATQAQVLDALRRFASLASETAPDGRGASLPLRGQQALEAYVGPRRDEEKAFIHEAMGVDAYA